MRRFIFISYVFLCFANLASAQQRPLVSISNDALFANDIQPTKEQVSAWEQSNYPQAAKQFYQFTRVAEFVMTRFIEDVAATHGISAEPSHIAAFKQTFSAQEMATEVLDTLAAQSALQFSVDKYLYETHGGLVIFDPSHPMMPISAYVKALKEYQLDGRLTFSSNSLEQLFWQSFTRPNAIHVPSDKVTYTQPWWVAVSNE